MFPAPCSAVLTIKKFSFYFDLSYLRSCPVQGSGSVPMPRKTGHLNVRQTKSQFTARSQKKAQLNFCESSEKIK